jgi:hypothetical protein
MAIPLKVLAFLKAKQQELTDLVEFFKKPPPEEHGLHGYINPDVLARGAPQLASHTYCCYVLLRPHLALLDVARLLPMAQDDSWESQSILADLGIALLEESARWLSTEIKLAVRGIQGWNLLLKPTVAQEQLITQWYLEQLFTALEFLRDSQIEPNEADLEGVRGVFEEGENLIAQRHYEAALS